MAVCRCDPTQLVDTGPRAGQPHKPQVRRAVLKVNGQPVASRIVLHCRRCASTWVAQ